jgi:hypothetical protein
MNFLDYFVVLVVQMFMMVGLVTKRRGCGDM